VMQRLKCGLFSRSVVIAPFAKMIIAAFGYERLSIARVGSAITASPSQFGILTQIEERLCGSNKERILPYYLKVARCSRNS